MAPNNTTTSPTVRASNPLQKWIIGGWIAIVLCLPVPLYLLAGGTLPGRLWLLGDTIPLLFLLVLCLPVFYYYGNLQRGEIQALLDGEWLAHWRYSPEEWASFATDDWAWHRRRALLIGLRGWLIMSLAALLYSRDLAKLKIVWAACLGLALLIGGGVALWGLAVYLRRRRSVGEAFIGRDGIFQDGAYYTWGMYGNWLERVEFEPDYPPALHFMIKGTKGGDYQIRVLVPLGLEEEGRQLAARLSGKRLQPAPEPPASGKGRRNRRRKANRG